MAQQLTDQQIQDALSEFTQTPAFLALNSRDRMNAYIEAGNALSGQNVPTFGEGGLFQGIPGQSALETDITRAVGIAAGGAIAFALLAPAVGTATATGATGAVGTTAGSDVAGGGSATSIPPSSITNPDNPNGPLDSTNLSNTNVNSANTPLPNPVPSSTISTISQQLTASGVPPSTIQQVIAALGTGVGQMTTAAGNNALNQEQLGLTANAQNITGASDYQNELINTAGENQKLENTVLNNAALQSKITNPSVSPYDVAPPTYSPAFEAAAKSAAAMPYTPIAAPTPYTPISPSGVQAATGTTPSTLQTVGQWLAPALGIASAVAPVL